MATRVFTDAHAGAEFILSRREMRDAELSPGMREGVRAVFGEDLTADQAVTRILTDIRERGDRAIYHYTSAIDRADLDTLTVSDEEIQSALATVSDEVQEALQFSIDRIQAFHEKQHIDSWIDFTPEGGFGQLVRPLERIGIYAPGGTAPYPSSLLMTAIPAVVAGVEEIMVCTPPGSDGSVAPVILVAAHLAGIRNIYKIGGAQAIAAMAYGTETVPKVDKILGPGNIFVVLAKRQVYGDVDLDALPGPTETMLIADHTADPQLCAADLLAQAEHDPMASAILVSTDRGIADQVATAIDEQIKKLERGSVAAESLKNTGAIVVADDLNTAFELANQYAPEHLCLLIDDPWTHLGKIRHAGGVFIGENSPEAIGDYTAGPSHVMPTGRTARFASPVNVGDFLKVVSIIGMNEDGLRLTGPPATRIARAEGLTAHAAAVERRLEALRPD